MASKTVEKTQNKRGSVTVTVTALPLAVYPVLVGRVVGSTKQRLWKAQIRGTTRTDH